MFIEINMFIIYKWSIFHQPMWNNKGGYLSEFKFLCKTSKKNDGL